MEDTERRLASLVTPPVVLTLPGMEQVRMHRNLVYCANEDPNLRLDVYQPPTGRPGAPYPIVLLVHGGAGAALRPKDWGFFQSLEHDLEEGYQAWVIGVPGALK